MPTIFTQLTSEWDRHLATGGHTQTRRWARTEPALHRYRTFGEIRDTARHLHGQDSDELLLALARHAAGDPAAARVLLQIMSHGLRRLAARTTAPAGIDHDEWAAIVIAAAWERIRRYPTARRPRRVAANLLLDILHDITAHRRQPRLDDIPTDPNQLIPTRHPDQRSANPGEELHQLLHTAAHHKQLPAADIELIWATRIAGITINDLAARRHQHPGTLRRQRHHAETTLRHHALNNAA